MTDELMVRGNFAQYYGRLRETVGKVDALSAELCLPVGTLGGRSLDLLCYLSNLQQGKYRIRFQNDRERRAFGLWIPPRALIEEQTSPFSDVTDDEGYFVDRNSTALWADDGLMHTAFGIYREIHERLEAGWMAELERREEGAMTLQLGSFFEGMWTP